MYAYMKIYMIPFVNYDNEEEVMRQNISTFCDERQREYR